MTRYDRPLSEHPLYAYQSIRDWLQTLKPKSAWNYIYNFSKFIEWLTEQKLDVNPDQLLEMRKQDLKSDDPKQNHSMEHLLDVYENELSRSMSPWGLDHRRKTVQSFFRNNYLPLHFIRPRRTQPETIRTKQIPTQQEVQRLYEMCESWRDKAILLLMYQSGLTPVDVSARNVADLPESNPSSHVYFECLRSKTGKKAKTCLSTEFLEAARNYLAVRGQPDEAALFLGWRHKRLLAKDVAAVIQNALRKTDVTPFRSKNLRDAYKDALRAGQIDADVQDWMMGHKGRSGKQYGSVKIREAYARAWPFLRVTEQETVVAGEQEQRIQALEGEVAYLKESLVKIRDELREISQL